MFNKLCSHLVIFLLFFTSICFSSALIEKDNTIKSSLKAIPESNINNVEFTDSTFIKRLYQLMKDTHEIFEKNSITYWADGGTLLGCVRHKGIIPWDDDLDIAIDHQDVPQLQAIKFQLGELGYELLMGPWLKIQSKTGPIAPCYDEKWLNKWDKDLRFPWVDIFLFKNEGLKYIHESQMAMDLWPKDEFTIDSINKRQLSNFGSFKIWIPFGAEKQLMNFYGQDVLSYGVWDGGHKSQSSNEFYKWQLKESDKLPAELKEDLEERVKDYLKKQDE